MDDEFIEDCRRKLNEVVEDAQRRVYSGISGEDIK